MFSSAVHVTTIRYFEFCISIFRLVTWKIRYFEFCSLEFSRKMVIFSLRTLRNIFRKFDDFSWKNIFRKFIEKSQEQRTNFHEFRLHYFCTILYLKEGGWVGGLYSCKIEKVTSSKDDKCRIASEGNRTKLP